MRLTASQFETIRSHPQSTKLYLSIFQPQTIFAAQVNNSSATAGDRTIIYNNVTAGSYTAISADMTMLVGTTPGARDIGKIRVRSATSSQIVVSENNNINWQNGLYLTVLNYWELWPVYPRIIQNPANLEDVIFYKDYDIAYTNQNSIFGTFINIGPHRAAWLDPASQRVDLCFTSSGTYNILGNSLTYSWNFQGALVTGSTLAEPGTVTYTTPGHYVTRLTTTASNGAVDTTYRYVSIYNAANPPIAKWQLNSLEGSRDEGGYTASLKIFQDMSIPLQEHAVVVIYQDNYFGSTHQNIGGNNTCATDIFFVGYIDKDTIEYDWEHSEITFDALSITGIMKKSSGFSVSINSVASPSKWYELLDMDGKRALYHYLRWHTTALNIADFQFIGDDWKIQYFDSDRGSMYDAIDNYMRETLIGQTVADRQGKVWSEVQAMAYQNPTGSFPAVMSITTRDWRNQPSLEERLTKDISYIEYGGIAYSGVNTGTWSALMGNAPGNAPDFYGQVDSKQGLALQGQAQLNYLTGNVFANKNSPYQGLNLEMAINAQNLDIAPQETVQLSLTAQNTMRGVPINGVFIPQNISWSYDPDGFVLLPQITYKQLINGFQGQTITIPAVSDVGGGWSISKFNMPPFPSTFSSVPNDSGDDAPSTVVVHDPTAGWIMTKTFNTPSPAWYQINAGLTAAQYQNSFKMVICPNGACYVFGKSQNTANTFIARSDYLGGFWTVVMDATALLSLWGGGASVSITDLEPNPNYSETLGLAFTVDGAAAKLYIGSQSSWTFKQQAPDWGTTVHGTLSIDTAATQWILTGYSNATSPRATYNVYSADMSSLIRSGRITGDVTGVDGGRNFHLRYKDRVIFYQNPEDNSLSISENAAVSMLDAVGAGYLSNVIENAQIGLIALSKSDGLYLCATSSTTPPVRSFDGGYSWSYISKLPVLVFWHFDNDATDSSKWVAVSSYVYYTNNFWNSNPVDKQGNLPQINPLYQLNFVKVVQH
jgi:hypothetical protein